MAIPLKSPAEIDTMRASCRLAAATLKMIEPYVRPNVSTMELNDICHEYIRSKGAVAAPLNYRGFPKSICTSINEVICHGIPSKKAVLREGDIINVDITTILDGFHGDTSRTFLVGQVDERAQKLVRVAQECLDIGISSVRAGGTIGDIGHVIQNHAEKHGYSVVRDFVGHGIGRKFHEEPQVTHYGKPGEGARIVPGMTFTIEPMVNEGDFRTKVLKDGWTAVTVDGKWSAQFEHTIAVHHDGRIEVMTVCE